MRGDVNLTEDAAYTGGGSCISTIAFHRPAIYVIKIGMMDPAIVRTRGSGDGAETVALACLFFLDPAK